MEDKTNQQPAQNDGEIEPSGIKTIFVKLPEEIYDGTRENYEGENFQVTVKGETAYLWAYVQPPLGALELLIGTDIRGYLPVACCVTEWDVKNARPYYTELSVIELKSVQRKIGGVRIKVGINPYYALKIGVGYVFTIESSEQRRTEKAIE